MIFSHHGVEVGIPEAYALDFAACQVSGAVGDAESSFRCAMNQMGCYAKRLSQLFVFFDMPQHLRRGDVAVPADQRVVVRVFAELPYTGGEDDQFAAVGHGLCSL